MLKSEKKLAELNKILTNGKYNEINDSISILRSEEPFAGAVSLLADFYDKTKDEGLKLLVSEFFNDMKERSCRAEVIESEIITRLKDEIDTFDTVKQQLARELIAILRE